MEISTPFIGIFCFLTQRSHFIYKGQYSVGMLNTRETFIPEVHDSVVITVVQTTGRLQLIGKITIYPPCTISFTIQRKFRK